MMKYKYQNMKHVILHGMKPGEIKEFDHEILGGGIKRIVEPRRIEKMTINQKHKGDD